MFFVQHSRKFIASLHFQIKLLSVRFADSTNWSNPHNSCLTIITFSSMLLCKPLSDHAWRLQCDGSKKLQWIRAEALSSACYTWHSYLCSYHLSLFNVSAVDYHFHLVMLMRTGRRHLWTSLCQRSKLVWHIVHWSISSARHASVLVVKTLRHYEPIRRLSVDVYRQGLSYVFAARFLHQFYVKCLVYWEA